ncbi:hypothetical protein NH340_JMT02378 [Sarcoptes scabiei]|nr:hypothetical protein NH340_JMT02378 [Sarcoptes scabiei]
MEFEHCRPSMNGFGTNVEVSTDSNSRLMTSNSLLNSSMVNENIDSSNAIQIVSNGEQASSQKCAPVSPTKSIKLVLKVGQSGSYCSSNNFNGVDNINNLKTPINEKAIESITDNHQFKLSMDDEIAYSANKPPELLPLTVDSYINVDFNHINNSLKKSKKKKKKHHHHHHHHHHEHHHYSSHMISKMNLLNDCENQNRQTNFLNHTNDSLINQRVEINDCTMNFSNQSESLGKNSVELNSMEEDDGIMGSILNQDSIFSSVDLIDVDSCSKLDISALVTDELNDEDVSQQSTTSSFSRFQSNYKSGVKIRPTSSVYRQLLQQGQVVCDSNNIYDHLRRKNKLLPDKDSVSKVDKMQQFLFSLLQKLQLQDPQKLFAWPVIESLTPGYSQVVSHPMDFYTIKKKIEHNIYNSVAELKFDVRLLCENAIRYHRHSGLHFKQASKLWHFAKTKVFARDQLAKHITNFNPLTMIDLGMDDFSNLNCANRSTMIKEINNSSSISSLHRILSVDSEIPQQSIRNDICILAETKESDSIDTERKSIKHLDSFNLSSNSETNSSNKSVKMPRLAKDGTTTLPFVLPDFKCDTASSLVTFGNLVNELSDGTASIAPDITEKEIDQIRPIEFTESSLIDSFTSHLPYFDSSASTISHQDSSLIFETFSKYLPSEHCSEIERVADDLNYSTGHHIDSLLSIVSKGHHKMEISNQSLKDRNELATEIISSEANDDADEIQNRLNETKNLLQQLETIQTQRLSSTKRPLNPSQNEMETAIKVTESLSKIIKNWFHPKDVIDAQTVHKHLGIILDNDSE